MNNYVYIIIIMDIDELKNLDIDKLKNLYSELCNFKCFNYGSIKWVN